MGSDFLCLIANVRDYEDSPLVYFNCEVTIEIGDRTVRRTLLHHRGSNDRFACSVDHRTTDPTLRVHYSTRQESKQTQKKFL